jgi:hypothetical protein
MCSSVSNSHEITKETNCVVHFQSFLLFYLSFHVLYFSEADFFGAFAAAQAEIELGKGSRSSLIMII